MDDGKGSDQSAASSASPGPEKTQEIASDSGGIESSTPDYSGSVLGGYRLVRQIAEGGMGVVYEGIQLNLSRKVAIKILNEDLAARPEFVRRFQREAKAAAALNHPNMVQVHDFCEADGRCLLVMEFVEGLDLTAWVEEKGKLPVAQALDVVEQAALALKAACEKSVVHRDIKPSNLMMTNNGQVKVSDLGLAKITNEASDLTLTGAGMGSPYFIAPEQASDAKDADHRADIYSLGLTLLFLVTGKRPYDGNTPYSLVLAHATKPLPRGIELGTKLPDGVEGLVQKMSAKRPDERYADYDALLADLRRVKAGQAPVFDFGAFRRNVFSMKTGVAALAVIAVSLASIFFLSQHKPATNARLEAPAQGTKAKSDGRPTPSQGLEAEREGIGPPEGLPPEGMPEGGGGGAFRDELGSASGTGQSTIPFPLGPMPRPNLNPLQDGPVETMLAQAEAYAKEHPQNYRDMVDHYRQVVTKARGTSLEQEVSQRLNRVAFEHQTMFHRTIQDFTARMDAKIREQKPQEAYDLWKAYPENLRTHESDREIQQILQTRLPQGFVPK